VHPSAAGCGGYSIVFVRKNTMEKMMIHCVQSALLLPLTTESSENIGERAGCLAG
jgi:hypothetical protein